jgi:hypothetical protein
LWIRHNPTFTFSPATPRLNNLTEIVLYNDDQVLKELNASGFIDFTSLVVMPKLKILKLVGVPIQSTRGIARQYNLERVTLIKCGLVDATDLNQLPRLDWLNLQRNNLPLAECMKIRHSRNLTCLNLDYNPGLDVKLITSLFSHLREIRLAPSSHGQLCEVSN